MSISQAVGGVLSLVKRYFVILCDRWGVDI